VWPTAEAKASLAHAPAAGEKPAALAMTQSRERRDLGRRASKPIARRNEEEKSIDVKPHVAELDEQRAATSTRFGYIIGLLVTSNTARWSSPRERCP